MERIMRTVFGAEKENLVSALNEIEGILTLYKTTGYVPNFWQIGANPRLPAT